MNSNVVIYHVYECSCRYRSEPTLFLLPVSQHSSLATAATATTAVVLTSAVKLLYC